MKSKRCDYDSLHQFEKSTDLSFLQSTAKVAEQWVKSYNKGGEMRCIAHAALGKFVLQLQLYWAILTFM
jgi:hypothetical protein